MKVLSHLISFYDDFTGKDSEQNKIIIGFRLSSYASGSTAVAPIDDLCHIPKSMKTAVKVNFYRRFCSDVASSIGLKSKISMLHICLYF